MISLETLQIFFDLITHAYGSFGPSLPTQVNSTLSNDIIHRESILELLLDIIVKNRKEISYFARNCIDWLREVCDEVPENCQKVLKSPGLHPLIVILSIWSVGFNDHTSDETDVSNIINDTKLDKSSSLSVVNEPIRRTSLKSNLSNTNPSDQPDEQRFIDASKEYKPIELNHIPVDQFKEIHRDSQNNFSTLQAVYIENYKLQLSCCRFIRQLMNGSTNNIPNQVASNSTGFKSSHITFLLSFCVVAAR